MYKPDIELMCTTITQQVLANPSADLPAQYNTFVLHVIEGYYQSNADVQELQMRLSEQTECNQTTIDELHRAISSWPWEKAHMLQSQENTDYNTLHSTEPGKEAIVARLQKHDSTVQTPKSGTDYENNSQKQKQAEKTGASERHQLMSSARKYRQPSAATIGVESSRAYWPSSPLQHGMELIDCDAFSAESNGEGHRLLISASDAFWGLEDDIASHLAWFTLRLKCQPGDIISVLSELLRSTQKGLQSGLTPSTSGTLHPIIPTASGKVVSPGKGQILSGGSKKLIGSNRSLSIQSIRALGHRRGFSFFPGDDSTNPILFNTVGGQYTDCETISIRPLDWQDTKQGEHNGSGASAKGGLSGGMAVGSRSQQPLAKSIVSLTAGSDVSRSPQPHGSGKSDLTTIIDGSSRSSSLSQRDSLNSNVENDTLRECFIRRGNSHLAVAAARAART